MPKQLSVSEKRIVTQTLNILNKLGISVPVTKVAAAASTRAAYAPSRSEFKRFVNALNTYKQVVVSINGPSRRFTVSTVNGFLNRREHIARVNKARLSKRS